MIKAQTITFVEEKSYQSKHEVKSVFISISDSHNGNDNWESTKALLQTMLIMKLGKKIKKGNFKYMLCAAVFNGNYSGKWLP